MFRFHDVLDPGFHLVGLLFPGRKGQTRQVGTKESEHIFDNSYKSLFGTTKAISLLEYIVLRNKIFSIHLAFSL
jgi:hypothetical protein